MSTSMNAEETASYKQMLADYKSNPRDYDHTPPPHSVRSVCPYNFSQADYGRSLRI